MSCPRYVVARCYVLLFSPHINDNKILMYSNRVIMTSGEKDPGLKTTKVGTDDCCWSRHMILPHAFIRERQGRPGEFPGWGPPQLLPSAEVPTRLQPLHHRPSRIADPRPPFYCYLALLTSLHSAVFFYLTLVLSPLVVELSLQLPISAGLLSLPLLCPVPIVPTGTQLPTDLA